MFGRNEKGDVFHNTTTSSSGEEYPFVDQVLTASINLGDFGTMGEQVRSAFGDNIQCTSHHMARTLLRASYEATYLAAILQQRKALYLTLVGGGCFQNHIRIVVEEIQRAHQLWAGHPASPPIYP